MTDKHYETFITLDTDRLNLSNVEPDQGEQGEEGLQIHRKL